MSGPPTSDEIRNIAAEAVEIFRQHGLSCCLFGSAACELYGRHRVPNDLDIIVMTNSWDTEYLKGILCRESNEFFDRPARSPNATYRVLFYRLHGRRRRPCKVDVLIPGSSTSLNLPFIDDSHFEWLAHLPVLPFLPLLILKVQGWRDHRNSTRRDFVAKRPVDIRDINELLGIGRRRREDIQQELWIPDWFLDHGNTLVQEYVDAMGGGRQWELIGFNPSY
ncbi:hypothetical protein EIP91_001812 [Steccherinum ochraceum]|uniref:Uncharacterized protein n=1 Tax=Steccherinum ochraceum TaxID=92696 RepID=A0A4R0RPX9_9APHY|nr:hypothetical protein EIP91_001812 [Steccherinum ochraceum]